MKIETVAVHAGHKPDPATGAVAPPIHLSTTFERDADGSYPRGYLYGARSNPNREMLESCMTALEGGAACAAFASGTAAATAVFRALRPGDHVIAPRDIYRGTARLLTEGMTAWGLEVTVADLADAAAIERELRPTTRLIWVETPSNPLLAVTDIARAAELAHRAGARLACDNTWATPVLQRPFEHGADLVMHASTKYLGGHSDVVGGVVVSREEDEFFARVRKVQTLEGAVPSPFDCWLILRGVRTLPHRVRAQAASAERIAAFLAAHPRVERVYYPGLAAHPGHDIARRQMSAPGAMLSAAVTGGREAAMSVAARVEIFTRATSLGGTESLIEHRASIEGPGTRAPENLLRLSIGLEHADDLVEDLRRALG